MFVTWRAGVFTVAALASLVSASVLAQPALAIRERTDGSLELQWTQEPADLTLESTATLAPPIDWSSAGLTPLALGDERTVVLAPTSVTRFFRLAGGAGPAQILSTSPADEETGVSVNRETLFRFDRPLAPETVLSSTLLSARGAGRVLLTRVELATDRRSAALFYLEPIPASTRVTVTLDGFGILDDAGRALDADADGLPGGVREVHFTTVNATPVGQTAVIGRVFASEKNPDGSDLPLAGVTLTVDGAEQTLRTVTGADGAFVLQPAPAGRFFVHVDGRTATASQWPGGAYYPSVGKAWEAVPGRTNNLANGDGLIYLPRIPADALLPVSAVEPTTIEFSPSILAAHPELAGVQIQVPPNALFSDAGTRGGQVGLAPVAPDRLPEHLPPGLQFPLVITIQTDGASNFDRPVPVRFPNLPDPVTGLTLPAGAKTALWSFNHDTGRWEIQGPMTISADGRFAETDPGVGILQPGWHGANPGSPSSGPTGNRRDDDDDDDDCKDTNANGICDDQDKDPCELAKLQAIFAITDFMAGAVGLIPDVEGALPNCALAATTAALQGVRDCGVDPSNCRTTVGLKMADFAVGCAANFTGNLKPVVDGLVFLKGALDSGLAYAAYLDCQELNPAGLTRHGPRPAEVARGNPFLLQYELEIRLGAVMDALYGAGWKDILLRDGPRFADLVEGIRAAATAGSPGGTTLTVQERASLLALPRPDGITDAQVDALVTRLTRLLIGEDPGGFEPAPLETATQRLEEVLEDLVAEGWGHTHEGYARGLAILRSLIANAGQGVVSAVARQDLHPAADPPVIPGLARRPHAWWLLDLRTGFTRRGQLNASGAFEGLILAPDTDYLIGYADPLTGRAGVNAFRSKAAGLTTPIPGAVLAGPPAAVDRDGDALSDLAERIVGTNPDLTDTDGDGLSDGAEFLGGSHPLDGQPLALGLVAQRPTAAPARAVATSEDLALVATGSGFAVFNVRNPLDPAPLSEFAFGGTTVTTLATVAGRALVPTNNGVRIFALGDGRAPTALGWLPTGITPVTLAAAGPLAYAPGRVGTTNTLAVIAHDLPALLAHYPLPAGSGTLQQLRLEGDRLWALTWSSPQATLLAYAVNGRELLPLGSLVLSDLRLTAGQTGPELAVAPGRAYVADANRFQIIDTTDPEALIVLNTSATGTASAFRDLALNGTGLMLTSQSADFALYAVTGDRATNYLLGLTMPDDLRGLALHRGMALTALNDLGLGVLHFQSADSSSNPPTITLQAQVSHPPHRQESGAFFTLAPRTTDNIQVRLVECFIDDQLAARSGGFPFTLTVRAPTLSATHTNFVVRARATDTGGNASWSDPLTLELVADETPPGVQLLTPAAGADLLPGQLVTAVVAFNESINPATLAPGLQLTEAGPDGTHGTADDRSMAPSITPRWDASQAELRLSPAFPSGLYRLTATTHLQDASGIALAAPLTWTFRIRNPAVTASAPANNSQHRPGNPTLVTARFSVLMDAASLRQGGFLLVHTGPDSQPGTADDLPIDVAALRFSSLSNQLQFLPSPPLPSGRYRAQLNTNALDTLGNPLTSVTTWDFTVLSPTATQADPPNGHARPLGGLTTVRVLFTDPIDPGTLAAGLRLTLTDGTAIPGGTPSFDPLTFTASLTFPTPLAGGEYLLRATPALTDIFGNPLGAEFTSRFGVHGPVSWAVDADGQWDVAANWSPGRPIPGDDVLLDRPAGEFTVSHTTGHTWLNTLTAHEPLRLTGGSLTLQSNSLVSAPLRVQSATLSNRAELRLTGPTTFGNAARVRGGGTLQIVGPARLEGGTLVNAIQFDGQRIRVESGPLTWVSGDLTPMTPTNAHWQVAPGGTLEALAGPTRRDWQGSQATLWNQGTFRQSGDTNLLRYLSLAVTNDGLWEILDGHAELRGSLQQSGRLYLDSGSSLRIQAEGSAHTVSLTAGAVLEGPGQLILDRTDALLDGHYAVTGGTWIENSTATFTGTLEPGPGPFTVANSDVTFDLGPLNWSNPLTVTGGTLDFRQPTTLGTLRWEYGRIRSTHALTITSPLQVGSLTVGTASQYAGPGPLHVSAGLTLGRGFTLESPAVLEHSGPSLWGPPGTTAHLTLEAGTVFRNRPDGRFEIITNRPISGAGTFQNQGLLVKAANPLTNTIAASLDHSGTLEVAGGRLQLSGGGTLGGSVTLAADSVLDLSGANPNPLWLLSGQFTGPGTLLIRAATNRLTGSLNGPTLVVSNTPFVQLPADLTLTNPAVYGGTIQLAGPLQLVGSNTLLYGSGRFQGPGILRTEGRVVASTPWFDTPIQNAGEWIHASSLRPRFAAGFRNLPGATFTCTNITSGLSPEPTTGTFDNAGLLEKTGTGGATLHLPVTNRGSLIIAGTLSLSAGFTQTPDGVTRLRGGTLRFGNQTEPLLQGTLYGPGTLSPIVADFFTFTNTAATLRPAETGYGQLTLSANAVYLRPDSLLVVKISGLAAGSQHDQLRGASLWLGGQLQIEFDPAFTPAVGDRFRIVEATSRLQSFRTPHQVLGLDAALATRLNYLPDAVELEIIDAP